MHNNAQKAAEASDCANAQGKFWEYHDKLFANQRALTPDNLKQYAADIGLDVAAFNACLDSGEFAGDVRKDTSDGKKAGVSGTPAFFVNGRFMSGAQPFAKFKTVIDAELER